MTHDPRLNNIPRGMTSRGVQKAIIEYLLESGDSYDGKYLLDIPCGKGTFISSLRLFFPKAFLRGCDLRKPTLLAPEDFCLVDASHAFRAFPETPFDVIFSISGVMEFDNTLQFFTQCGNHLRDGGLFLITNDNIAAVRDRLSFFWYGTPKQYRLVVTKGQLTWKIIPISNMVRILEDAGFKIREIRYVPWLWKDWVWLPLALLIYPFQILHLRRINSSMLMSVRKAMYPFRSLLSRHYILISEKIAQV